MVIPSLLLQIHCEENESTRWGNAFTCNQGPIYLVYYVPDVTKSTGILKIFGFSNCCTALFKGQIYTVNGSFWPRVTSMLITLTNLYFFLQSSFYNDGKFPYFWYQVKLYSKQLVIKWFGQTQNAVDHSYL